MRRIVLGILLLSACGDDNGMQTPPQPDASAIDAPPVDAAVPDAAPDGPKFISQPASTIHEQEPMIAADGQGMVVGAWIGYFSNITTNGYAVSSDDGMTWARPKQLDSPGARASGDPVVAADAAGNFYLTWLGFARDAQGNATDIHVYASTLDRTMGAFGTPVEVTDGTPGNVDKPWITAIDGGSKLLVTWADLGNLALRAAVSTDQGATWTPHVVRSGTFANLAFPCTDPTVAGSPIYVTFMTGGGAGVGVGVRKSIDNGVTWTAQPGVANDGVFQDPTCAAHGANDVWVLYPQGTSGGAQGSTTPAASVRIAHSTDGAATWGGLVTITDSTSSDIYLLPQMARTSNGNLHAVFYQGAIAGPAMLVHALSTDGGTTWTRSSFATPGKLTIDRTHVTDWLGDYLGIYAAGSSVYVDFGDNSSTNTRTHVGFARLPQ